MRTSKGLKNQISEDEILGWSYILLAKAQNIW